MTLARALLVGLAAWAAATALLRLGGQLILPPGAPAPVPGVLLVAVLAVAGAVALRRWLAPRPGDADAFAVGLVAPGLLLDAGAVLAFGAAFPNMVEGRADGFAALMLWGYGLILLAVALDGRLAARAGPAATGPAPAGSSSGPRPARPAPSPPRPSGKLDPRKPPPKRGGTR